MHRIWLALLSLALLLGCDDSSSDAATTPEQTPESDTRAASSSGTPDASAPERPACAPTRAVEQLVSPAPGLDKLETWRQGSDFERVVVPNTELSREALTRVLLKRLGEPIPESRSRSLEALEGTPLASLPEHVTFSVDLTPLTNPKQRLLLLETAREKGLVLLETAHDTLVYLGRDDAGEGWVWMAARSGVESPCAEDPEQSTRVFPTTVGLVPLSHHALVSQLTRLHVVGEPPGVAFAGIAELREPRPLVIPEKRSCRDSQEVAIYFSPRIPNPEQPLRITVVSERDLGPVELVFTDGDGLPLRPPLYTLNGPPWTYLATVESPETGSWKAWVGEGDRIEACLKTRVRRQREAVWSRPLEAPAQEGATLPPEGTPPAEASSFVPPIWPLDRHTWTPAVENYYAAFVARLFDYPPDEDLTWQHLDTLLRDPERNLLYNHFSVGEDDALNLAPDCADLAYYMRGYFAWKMGLPFAFRRCSRGRKRSAPECRAEPYTNLSPRETHLEEDPVVALQSFLEDDVASSVHSSSGRTAPEDESTDFYPVALTRNALRPGIVFHDPYGHVMIVVRWIPQALGGKGMLLAADAQPDGTIGRRRFWRGTFMFTPSTQDVGAGFKAFRPFYYDIPTQSLLPSTNAELLELGEKGEVIPFSKQQYEGSLDDFYDTVEGLINPRPLDPSARLIALVEAFDEQVNRRVSSVVNGEKFMAERGFKPIEMPSDTAIFLTSGPWEDYSTPSRDMRLLIALDTVVGFPDAVRRTPERFGLTAGSELDATLETLREELDKELSARSFTYTRSNGAEQTLTLKDVTDRVVALEMAYNPNDCIEIRWGALEGSEERASCKRLAPPAQLEKMKSYRPWFETRQRPQR